MLASSLQRKIIDVDRGLFLIRYAGAEDAMAPPHVRVSADLGFGDQIRFLLHPDEDETVLWRPESSLVLRAESRAKLAIDVVPAREGGSVAATVNIEPLRQDKPLAGPPKTPETAAARGPGGFLARAHVAHQGDILANDGQWLGGPQMPVRIEGLQFEWPDKPHDLDIRYAVQTAHPELVASSPCELGSFAGFRGKAAPVVAIQLAMSGPGAANLVFAAEMLFLGCATVRSRGRTITGAGPSGREPLVGLRIRPERADIAAAREPARALPAAPVPQDARVRVFRTAPAR